MTRRGKKKSYLGECRGNKLWKGKTDNVGWPLDERSVKLKNNPPWQMSHGELERNLVCKRPLEISRHPARWSSPRHWEFLPSSLYILKSAYACIAAPSERTYALQRGNHPPHLCNCTDGVAPQLHRPHVPPVCFPDGMLVCRSSPGRPLPPGSVRASLSALSPVWFHLHPQKNVLQSLPQWVRKDGQRSIFPGPDSDTWSFSLLFKSSPRQQRPELLTNNCYLQL